MRRLAVVRPTVICAVLMFACFAAAYFFPDHRFEREGRPSVRRPELPDVLGSLCGRQHLSRVLLE